MRFDPEVDDAHAINPQPGDYWTERLFAVCVVLEATETHVTICREKREQYGGLWSWNSGVTTTMTREEFNTWLRYGGDGQSANKTWANCHTNARLTREEI
jgi:hypothetical protein